MRNWETRVKEAGAILLDDAGLIVNEAPTEESLVLCKALGEKLAS
jgi:flavorubredoxin